MTLDDAPAAFRGGSGFPDLKRSHKCGAPKFIRGNWMLSKVSPINMRAFTYSYAGIRKPASHMFLFHLST